jgi:hypothetical protein
MHALNAVAGAEDLEAQRIASSNAMSSKRSSRATTSSG